MTSQLLHTLKSVISPYFPIANPEARLPKAMRVIAALAETCSATSRELFVAGAELLKAGSADHGWNVIGPCFERGVDRTDTVRELARSHLAALPGGLRHVLGACSMRVFDELNEKVFGVLAPDVRDEIVRRWSEPNGSRLYVTREGLFAVDLPGTDFRCALTAKGLSQSGLRLTQHEATRLLLAQVDGDFASGPVLTVLPAMAVLHPGVVYTLLGAVIGPDGSLPPELDRDEIHALAAAVHDKLKCEDGTVELRAPFARFFRWMGDEKRAAQAHALTASVRSLHAEQGGGLALDPNLSGRERADEVSRINHTRAAIERQLAAFHYDRAIEPRLAATELLASASSFSSAGERPLAAAMYAAAAEKLASCGAFSEVRSTLKDAAGAYGADWDALSRICARCAEAFDRRGHHHAAAKTHALAAGFMRERIERHADIDVAGALACYERHFVRAQSDVPARIRSAIAARLHALSSADGLKVIGAVIRFDARQDPILFEAFDPDADTEWLLWHMGEQGDGTGVYHLVIDETREQLCKTGSRHPYFDRTVTRNDFIDGDEALALLSR
ncbi:hypothetical protein PCA31118_00552 [Pandoraea captiosa]|uniref:Uncharacterized protein n=1 Tax=Pandoraea captiosa TaxID=2508302 RepID=A0A5E4ZL12_9BURK|nr:hypothetical protein [Pandoraea captiosa]VVE61367.1 hypothetical protein PCA31118_00552 [Pandoraea captiosa]